MYAELMRKYEKQRIKSLCGNKMALLEGRFIYDAFVLGAKADGIYAGVENGKQAGAPVITAAGGAITEANATAIYYTTDGTDPRYSSTRLLIASGSAAAGHTSGLVVKAYAERTNYFNSTVTTATLSS